VRKVLGILILVLFLGTVFAGLAQAQGYSEHENDIKSGNGALSEIKPYIIVKRYAENKTIKEWAGNAVQNNNYGIDLVVGVDYYYYKPPVSNGTQKIKIYSDELCLKATVMAVGGTYSLGNNRWLKMKYLWLGASKDYLPGKVGDGDLHVRIPDDLAVSMWNLTNVAEKSGVAEWLRETKPYWVSGASMAAGGVVSFTGGGVLSSLVVSSGTGYVTEYIADRLIDHYAKRENIPEKQWNVSRSKMGYAYVKSLLHADWNKENAAIAMPFEVELWDEPTSRYNNHIITVRAVLGYDTVTKDWRGNFVWENQVKTIETYVSIHLVADDSSGRGEPENAEGYALSYTYNLPSGNTGTYQNKRYISSNGGNLRDITSTTVLHGYYGWAEYRTLHAGDYQLWDATYRYYQGLIIGADKSDYWEFTFDPASMSWTFNPNSYMIELDLIAGGGAPMKMDVEYRGVHYTLSTKDKRIATLDIWSPAWRTGQTQGKVMKIRCIQIK